MLSAKQVAPGESGQIEVTLKTETSGMLSKGVTVYTNDPRQPEIVLNVAANVEAEFALSELSIFFGNVPKGKSATKEILITIPPEKSAKVLSAQSSDSSVAVRLEPVAGADNKKLKLIAVQKPDAKQGYHFGTVTLKTSSSLMPELKIPVRGMITP